MYHIDEDLFPAFGALGGASGAIVLMYIDALAEAGVRAGFARPIAEEIATATVMGSGALAMKSSEHPIALMNAVCSPGGTTIEGVCKLRELGFDTAVQQALQAIIARTSFWRRTDAPASTVVAASRPVIADETIKNGRPLAAPTVLPVLPTMIAF